MLARSAISNAIMATIIYVAAFDISATKAGLICEETVYNTNLVRAVQRKLVEAKVKGVVVDGKWNERTIKLLQQYQEKKKIARSADLDEATFTAMFGSERKYEPISHVIRNPHNAPEDIYREHCAN